MDAIIEVMGQILGEVVLAMLSIAGAWVLSKLAKHKQLQSINAAANELIAEAQQTAAALQQTTVDKLKKAHEDGKLTEDEVAELNAILIETTLSKLSQPALELLKAAGKDITAMIQDAAESWILAHKHW